MNGINHKRNREPWLTAGRVGKAYGLKGDFYVTHRDSPWPSSCTNIIIGNAPEDPRSKHYKVIRTKQQEGRSIIACEHLNSREQLKELTGLTIWLKRGDLKLNDSSEYLWADLIDKPLKDRTGKQIGKITTVYNHGASDVVEIINDAGERLHIPLVAAYFDMAFKPDSPYLSLVVADDVFSELWY